MDELKCGICLELFQDPRSLPCLHTFCRECIQRSLNETDHSLKCPVCRANHELSDKGAELLHVDQYALQELPLKRLQQQQREDNGGQQAGCKSCGEQAPVVAWCEDCDAMICQQCLNQHQKMSILREHHVVKNKESELPDVFVKNKSKSNLISCCPRHLRVELKYWCARCSEPVCSECLLGTHKDHKYSMAEEARHSLETKMEELASLVENKKEEFSKYLVKASKAESEALEYSELMETKVNNVFDGIVVSVEAQRNEALQCVSQGVKEIWAQKEMLEIGLLQLDSFTRFADHTHKCTTDASYLGMATQGIKLMQRLEDTHGDESILDQKKMVIVPLICDEEPLNVPLSELFVLGQPSLKFSPAPYSTISCPSSGFAEIKFLVSFMVGRRMVISETLRKKYNLEVTAYIAETTFANDVDPSSNGAVNIVISYNQEIEEKAINRSFVLCSAELIDFNWKVTASVNCFSSYQTLVLRCRLSGDIESETVEVAYKY